MSKKLKPLTGSELVPLGKGYRGYDLENFSDKDEGTYWARSSIVTHQMQAQQATLNQQLGSQLSNQIAQGVLRHGIRQAAAQAHSHTANVPGAAGAGRAAQDDALDALYYAYGGARTVRWARSSSGLNQAALWLDEMTGVPKPVEKAPAQFGELTAYRMWFAKHGYLYSYSQDTLWVPDEALQGKVPGDQDSVGIWAFKSRDRAIRKAFNDKHENFHNKQHPGTAVYGSVKLWGEVVEHADGYRAEYAKIVSLDDCALEGREQKQELMANLRELYKVPA